MPAERAARAAHDRAEARAFERALHGVARDLERSALDIGADERMIVDRRVSRVASCGVWLSPRTFI
jgi:hypothetical protein